MLQKIIFIYILSFLCIFNLPSSEYTLSVCAIFQQEADYLKEWIDYHQKVGVEHFWLYNNNSTDHYKAVLKPYIDANIVELFEWTSEYKTDEWTHFCFDIQPKAYTDAINRSRDRTEWLAIIDTDEFILPMKYDHMKTFLENECKDVDSIHIGWVMFGTSYIKNLEVGKMLKYLVLRAPMNSPFNGWTKEIVRPKKAIKSENPHFCVKIDGVKEKIFDRSEIRLNHYWTRDESFFYSVKIWRYMKWGCEIEGILNKANELNRELDCEIHRIINLSHIP